MSKTTNSETQIIPFFLSPTFFFSFSDCGIVVIGHFVWTILSVLFVFSLLGVADEKQLLVLKQLINGDETVGLIGRDFWLIGDTLAESSLAGMELNWLWSGLLFCLVVLGKNITYFHSSFIENERYV